nr:L-arabinose isomerase [Portibacter marinus]
MDSSQALIKKEIWFMTGSQHLYGQDVLKKVDHHTQTIVDVLNKEANLLVRLVKKQVVTTPEEIYQACLEGNGSRNCIGVMLWMHTFSPAKMWIRGLQNLTKPICHLHTQFNSEIPWENIDMDFMNLNQSAHGDREFGFLLTRMRKRRKIVVGHWKSKRVHKQIDVWSRAVLGWHEMQNLKIARIGDNMREVAVTEGNKVSAQIQLGMSVNGYDTSDVLKHLPDKGDRLVSELIQDYEDKYEIAQDLKSGESMHDSLIEAARIEIALSRFLKEGNFGAFTNTFENLGAFKQLPGIAVQRLMEKGYGFGAEGDWKTAGLLRCMKVMSAQLEGGTSFMEDYTYHFSQERSLVLGSHMLEICPSITTGRPSCEIQPLGIGGKADPVRLVFDGEPGPGLNASLIDLGNRFRLVVNEVEGVTPESRLPHLPVARVLWEAKPDLETAATAWMLAGGAHHTVYSQALSTDFLEDWSEMSGIELLVIDLETKIRAFKDKIKSNEVYYHLFQNTI